jgi:hypothetical protein
VRALVAVAAVFLLARAPGISAAEGACGAPEQFAVRQREAISALGYDQALLSIRACLGEPISDADPLVTQFNAATPAAEDAGQRIGHIRDALTGLRNFARSRAAAEPMAASWRIVATQLEAEVAATSEADAVKGVAAIRETFWEMPANPDQNTLVADATIRPFEPTACSNRAQPCPAYVSRVELVRVFRLMNRLIGYADYPALEAHAADARLMSERWHAYFNKALPQYWWEVAINGARMGDDLCSREPGTGMQLGFCRVPTSQLIIAHPSVAMQWVHGADDTDDLAAAFVVEVFGRNSWRWKEGDPNIYGQFGWSLIAVYSNPGDGVEQWSYGVMVHKGPSLNLGLTTAGGGQVSLLVSVRLAERIFARKAEYLDYLKALSKPSWETLL